MANREHLKILYRGIEEWNRWREEHPEIQPDLSGEHLWQKQLKGINLSQANLSGIKGFEIDFSEANLKDAYLYRAELEEADFYQADLSQAILIDAKLNKSEFSFAKLDGANLYGSELWMATFIASSLREANIGWSDLDAANFSEADLTGANLDGSILDGVKFVNTNLEKAKISDCSVYGISVWNVRLKGATQSDLSISSPTEPSIMVDNIEVAQFIYLLLNNQKIRQIIDTITSKVVLILGDFPPRRKRVLDSLRDELRNHNYSPVLFNFEEYRNESFIESCRTLINMAHFVLVDLTDLDHTVCEIVTSLVPHCVVPIQWLILGNHRYDHEPFRDLQQKCRWVLSPHRYKNISSLLTSFQKHIIQPVEEKIIELKQRKPLKIFLGYAYEDRDMLDNLKKHLRPLERSGQIQMWDDRDIEPGNAMDEVVERQISDARIILLLMSPDFLASNDCYAIQEKAMELYEGGHAKVIPILVRSCAWKSTALAQLQILPRDGKPIKEHSLDDIFFKVSEEISDFIKEII